MNSLTQLSIFDTIEIPLTKGYVATIDIVDADLAQFKWCTMGRAWPYTRRVVTVNKQKHLLLMHRIILERIIGRPLKKGEYSDHIDGNIHNNRRSNLRLATASQNGQNHKIRKDNKTGVKGVRFCRGSYHVTINFEKKRTHLGCFKTLEEAKRVYEDAATKLHGAYRRIES